MERLINPNLIGAGNKNGRPTIYTPELANEICNTIAASSKGIKRLCEERPHWPCKDTIFTWRKSHTEFSDLYAQAKMYQIEVLVDEMFDITDDPTLDNLVAINRARLQLDLRKWLACKLVPRVYGNKADNAQSISQHEEDLQQLR